MEKLTLFFALSNKNRNFAPANTQTSHTAMDKILVVDKVHENLVARLGEQGL